MKHRLEVKMIAIFSSIILVIIISYFAAFKVIYENHEYKLISEESINTLQTMKRACMSLIGTADNYSKILLADNEIQEILKTEDIYGDPRKQSKLIQRIFGLLQFEENISSVYFVDQKRQIFSVGEKENLYLSLPEQVQESWYHEMQKNSGRYILLIGNKAFTDTPSIEHVSLVRSYINLDNFTSLGFMAVNIDMNAIRSIYKESVDETKEEILFFDEKDQVLCMDGKRLVNQETMDYFLAELKNSPDGLLSENLNIGNTRYLAAGVTLSNEGWKIIRLMPINVNQKNATIMTMNIILVFMTAVLILLGTSLVTRMMTVPVQKILASMKQAEQGEFVKIAPKSFFNEFRYLIDGYNRLMDKITELLAQTVEEHKIIRRIELNEMHEQMKPHFLYNTLDSIEALAMMGENERVCDIAEALGDFYRKSVSKGREMLPVEEELTIVNDYIRIMKIRYENLFKASITVEDSCREHMIPKLTLQPIVENAIHHGLREREGDGMLQIDIKMKCDWMHIRILDNGPGFSQEVLKEIRQETQQYHEKSFGLRGTIERLRIIYGDDFKFTISSEAFVITEISFYIHKKALEVGKDGKAAYRIGG